MKVYALGLKGWVELRRAAAPPQPDISVLKIKRNIAKRTWVHDDTGFNGGFFRDDMVPVKKEIRVYNWKGGRKLGLLRASKFRELTGISLREGAVVALLPEQIKRSLDKGKAVC